MLHTDSPALPADHSSDRLDFLADLWYLMAGRIAPQMCCRYPPPMQAMFQAALREVSKQDGDLDLAVRYLHDIIIEAPCEWMVFQQAGQLLNIIEWRRLHHPAWFSSTARKSQLKLGCCGQYVAHAMALLEVGNDRDVLAVTSKILEKGPVDSDDLRIAHLLRAALYICAGEIRKGEEEFSQSLSP